MRRVRARHVDERESPEYGVHTVSVGHVQERLVGDEWVERERNGRDGGTMRAHVHREHLAQQHDRDEADADGVDGGEHDEAHVRRPSGNTDAGSRRVVVIVQAEYERDNGQSGLGAHQQRFPAHPVDQSHPDKVDGHDERSEHHDVLGLAHARRRFRQQQRPVCDQAADAAGPLRGARRHHHR